MFKKIAVLFVSTLLGGLVVALAMPRANPLPRTVQADKFILNGANGLPRAIISGGGDDGPSILLLNREAKPVLMLAAPDEGGPSIQLGEGAGRIFLTTKRSGLNS